MPVADHPVHPKTKIGDDFRYGCHNRPAMSTGYFAPDRVYKPDGTYHTILRRVQHQTSVLCKYDLWHSDWGCEGCRWMAGQVPVASKELFKKEEECND
jgi:hypothetical protein